MSEAIRYSFSFCWRNNRKATIARLIFSVLNTVILYLVFQASAMMFNSVPNIKSEIQYGHLTFWQMVRSGTLNPAMFFIAVVVFGMVLGQFHWFYKSLWNHSLRIANDEEVKRHRATLDVARFVSKEYDDLVKKITELPMSWNSRLSFSDEMFNLFGMTVSFFLFGMSLLWYEPMYAAVLFATAIPMFLVDFGLVASWWKLYEEMLPHHKKRYVLDRVFSGKVAFTQGLLFNQHQPLAKQIAKNQEHVLNSYEAIRKLCVRREILTHLLTISGLGFVVVHVMYHTLSTGGKVGTLSIVIAAARTFQSNLESIVSSVADQWNSAKGVIMVEKEYFGLRSLLETPDPITPDFTHPCIHFDRVSYTYPNGENPALIEVSFKIEPGSKVAIVGKSGNGKSTIMSLLMRHIDPTSGAIYADGLNLRNILPGVWNEFATALTQDYTIIERPIGEEISSSRLDGMPSEERIRSAAELANFHEVVAERKGGFDEQIGTDFGGCEFSGGEKQRLALARVFYRGTPIVILDEPDARLDPDSANKLMDSVFALEGVTVIMITHHVSRAEHCDKVIVMGKGCIAEQGTPDELMARGGVFSKLCESDKKRLGKIEIEA